MAHNITSKQIKLNTKQDVSQSFCTKTDKNIPNKGATVIIIQCLGKQPDFQGLTECEQCGNCIDFKGISFQGASAVIEKSCFQGPNRWHCLIKGTWSMSVLPASFNVEYTICSLNKADTTPSTQIQIMSLAAYTQEELGSNKQVAKLTVQKPLSLSQKSLTQIYPIPQNWVPDTLICVLCS